MDTPINRNELSATNNALEVKPFNKIFERVKLRYDKEIYPSDGEKFVAEFHTQFDNHTNFTEHSNHSGG